MMRIVQILTSKRGLNFDKYLIRYSGYSMLNRVFAFQHDFAALPAVLLRTLGRQSGVWREVVLPYFCIGEERVVVGSKGGAPADPQWVGNLRTHPQAEVFTGRRLQWVTARFLADQEYEQVWQTVTARVAIYGEYQARCRDTRRIPLVALHYE